MVNSTLRVRLVIVFLLATGLFKFQSAFGQVTGGYTFSQSSGTYTSITGTSVAWSGGGNPIYWHKNVTTSGSGTALTLPFTFTYNGTAYTTCNVSSNGWISFGTTAPTTTNYTPIAANNPYAGAIAAFGDDLITDSVHAVTYLTQGASPNQTFTIQWTGARRSNGPGTIIDADNLNFQIILSQNGTISCTYGSCTADATVDSAQVGLRGTSNVDFNARASSTSWSSTTTGTTNAASIWVSSTKVPASGLTFTWTPCTNSPLTLPVTQGFNSTNSPGCWNTQYVNGTRNLLYVPSSTNPATTPEEGSDYVLWNANAFGTAAETRLFSPPITTGASPVQVSFYWFEENSRLYDTGIYLSEGATLEWSTDGNTWNSVKFFPRQDSALVVGTGQWFPEVVDLPAGASNQSTLYVGWDFVSEGGDNCSLDNIDIDNRPALDAGVSGFVVPVPLNPSAQPIEVLVTNYGTSTLTSVTIDWSVDGVAQTPVLITGLSLLSDSTTTLSLGTYTFLNGTGANTILANTTLPNGGTDGNVYNDTAFSASLYACLSGTYTVGVGQQFTSLTSAVNYANTYGICGPTTFVLTDASYILNETFPIILTAATTATDNLTIVAATGNTATISSASTTGIFALNSAGYVTFNGGTGTQRNIVFSSSGNGGYDLQVNNTCLNVAINNCALQGNNGNNIDVEGAGASSLTVTNCDIHDYATGSYALNGVYVNNHSSAVVVSGCNIYNFTNIGVDINACDNSCSILNNNLWYAGTATTSQNAIYVLTGNGNNISGNYIGGQAAGGGIAGSPWTNSASASFFGINIAGYTGVADLPDTIAGNVIQNISLTGGTNASFYGINLLQGSGARCVIGYPGYGNRIGSTNAALGITNNATHTAFMEGIWDAGGQVTLQYDTIANLSAPSVTGSNANSTVGGIYFHCGNNSTFVNNCVVSNLSNSAPFSVAIDSAYVGSAFNVQGIVIAGRAGSFIAQNNVVNSLYSTATSATYPSVVGIAVDSTGSGFINSNLVYDLQNAATSASPAPGIAGIRAYLGTWDIYNNQVILTNNYNTNAATVYGISDLTGRASNYFYNSIYIGGGANTGSAVSAAFNMDSSSSTMTLRDNIFYNVRTNTGSASGNNYAIDLNVALVPTAFSSDYNDLYSVGTAANYIGIKGNSGTPESFTGWKTQFTNVDLHSKNVAVYFKQSNPPVSDLTPYNYSNCSIYQAGTPITTPTYVIAVPNDYNATVRNTTTPDIGAIEFKDSTALTSITSYSGANSSTTSLTVCTGSSVDDTVITNAPGTLTYTWSTPDAYNPGSVSGFTRTVTAAMAGTYKVTVTDYLSCTSSATVTLIENPQPVFTATPTNVLCNGGTGQIAVTVSIGTSPFTYSINGGTSFPYSASPITGLSAAIYNVEVEDAHGCISAASTAVTITQPTALAAPVITGTNVLCNGGTGSIAVTTIPTGGTSPYKYSLNGGAYQTSTSFTGLAPNTYTVTAEDANSCTAVSNTVIITQPTALTAPVITGTNVTCRTAANGTIAVSTIPTGGTSPYQYSLNGGAYQTGTAFSSLAPNTYSVTAKDANGCLSPTSNLDTITQPAAALSKPVISATNVTCYGAANGIVTVTSTETGGTPPYQFAVNGGAYQTSLTFTGLVPASYTVVCEDANGCLSAASTAKTITQPAALTAPVITPTNVVCFGGSTGVETVSTLPTGGTSPYQYSLNGGAYQTSTVFSGLPAEIDVVTAKDANGCTINSNNDTITQPATALVAGTGTVVNDSCNGLADGKITFTAATGGAGNYRYQFNGTGTFGTLAAKSPQTGLAPGTYTFTVKDATGTGCAVAYTSVTITQPTALVAPVISDSSNVLCNGGSSGVVKVSTVPTGGTSPYKYSINGGAYQTSTIFTGLAFNTYTVTAEDNLGCTATSNSVTISQPTALTAPVISGSSITCFGHTNGDVNVTTIPTGGTSPYKYSLNGGGYQTSTLFPGLAANTYTVTAEDANSCTVSSNSVVVSAPVAPLNTPAITANTEVLCYGASTGIIKVTTPTGNGQTPYQYSLNGGAYQTSTTFSNLAAGTYSLEAEDANSCSVAGNSVTITQPASALVAGTSTFTNVTCNGANNGTITYTAATGGTTPYRYQFNGGAKGTLAANGSPTGLAPGTYTFSVDDNTGNGCVVAYANVTISQPTALTAPTITSTNVLCNGGSTGTVTVSTIPTGGTSPYKYSINGGAYQTSTSFTGLAANTYTVTAEDANSCTIASNSVIITQPAVLAAAVITSTNVLCNAAANGTVTVSTIPTGGTSPYQYSLNGGAYQTSTSFTGLAPNTYTVTSKDANGCTSTSNSVTITQPASLTAPVITSTNVLCNGSANGTVTVSTIPTGGTSPYQYSLNGGAYQTSVNFTGLAPNTYTVTAQDANSCTIASNSVIITQPSTLTAPVVTVTNVSCNGGSNGTATVSTLPTGGTSPYQYSLNGGGYQTSVSFTGLVANTYTVTAQDANGCTIASAAKIITQPSALVAPVIASTNVSCNGAANGTVTVSTIPTGGVSPYQYSLNGGAYQTGTLFSGLVPNTYTVTAQDANSCTVVSNSVIITQPASLVAPVITASNVTCSGSANGTVSVSTIPTGGTSPYQYSLNGGAYQTSTSFTGLVPNTYTVTVKDADGCTIASNSVTITQPTSLVAPVITATNVTCNGSSNGTVSVSTIPTGGTSPYQYSLNGGAYQTSTSFTGLAPNTYTVTAQDANGCTIASNSKTITQPTALVAPVISSDNVSCFGSANGIVSLITLPSGGTPSYLYSLNGGAYQAGVSFSGLSPNTYTVTTEDANSCTINSNSVVITQPTALTAPVITSGNVLCNGGATGTVSVSTGPSGGSSPYSYSLNGGAYQTSTSFTGLSANTYSVTAKDANGCTIVSNSVTVTQPTALTAPVFTKTNVLCNGGSTGTITVSTLPTGGTSPYQYELNSGAYPYQTSTSFTGLPSGAYVVTAEDANGCTINSTSKTITQPTALAAPTITSTNVLCNGGSGGTVTVSTIPTGGTSPYTYSLNGGAYQTSTSFTGLPINTYTVTAEDANSCTVISNTVVITQPTALTAPVITVTSEVTCNGASNGVITVTTLPTGGTSPYQYSINAGGTYQTSTVFTGLAPGTTYKVLAQDANGCTKSSVGNKTITQPAALTAPVISSTNVSCNGGANGIVTVSTIPTGGTSPYTYSINGGAYQTSTSFTGLAANTYTVIAQDANSCTISSNSTIVTQPTALVAPVITGTNLNCNGVSTGIVTVTTIPSGGTSPYTYSLNGSAYQTSTSFTALAANTYTVTAKDANGCTIASNSVTLTQPAAMTAPVITATNVSCNGAANGTVTVSTIPTGGTSPYQYSLNGGAYQTSTGFTALAPATYTVTAQDANGCTIASNSIAVTQPAVLTAPLLTPTNITCNGLTNGVITVSTIPTGGTSPYQYSINGGVAYQTSTSFTGLGVNTYTVIAEDANGCTVSSASSSITQPTALATPTLTVTNEVTCNGTSTGKLTGSLGSGGTSPYTYILSNGTTQSTRVFSNLPIGTYNMTVKDANGCTAVSPNRTITQPAVLVAPVITNVNVSCNGSVNGTVNVSTLPTGGTTPYQYSLNGGAYQTATSFTGLSPNTYTVTVEDANSCTATSNSVIITQPTSLVAPVITSTNVLCNGGSTGTVTVSTIPTGGTSPYTYSLNGGAYQTPVNFTGLAINTYTVTAKDANGCTIPSNSVIITQPTALTAPVIAGTNLTCHANASGTISVNTIPTGGTSPYQYSLNGGAYQTSTSFTGLAINTYTVTAKDANGCTIASNSVILTQPATLTVPVITPTNATCNGSSNGIINVTTIPTGGTSPYQYSLNGGGYQTSTSFTGLAPNTYTVTAQDANGCTVNSASKIITQPSGLTAPVITSTDVSCYGGSNGVEKVSTIPTGGTSPYQYSLNGGAYQTSTSFTGLPPQVDIVTAKDANGCTITSNNDTITQPTALVPSVLTATNVTCNGLNNGSLASTAPTGGTQYAGAFKYRFSLNDTAAFGTTRAFSNLVPGVYYLTCKDANGCLANSDTVTISQPAALTAPVITSTNVTCYNSANGTVTVSTLPTGGTTPYQYSLNGGAYQTSTLFSSLAPNTYTVTVQDANSCTIISNSDTITQPPAFTAPVITAPVITSTNISCFGGSNGTINITTAPSGGTSPYQYALNESGLYQTATTFTGLSAGIDSVIAQDANGCLVTSNYDTLTQPATPVATPTITVTAATCNGSSTGKVTCSVASGGTSPYTYMLSTGATQSTRVFSGLPAGTYNVTVEDANGCSATSINKTITQPTALTNPVIAGTNLTCNANATGTITVTTIPTGGTSPYQYSLNGGAYQTSLNFTSLAANTYTVTAEDANSCTIASNSVIVTQPTALTTPVITVNTEVLCYGGSTGKITVSTLPTGGTSPYQYTLNAGTYQTSNVFTGLPAGAYVLTAEDANGCTKNSTSKTITQPASAITAPTITSTNVLCNGGSSGTVTVSTLSTGGTSPYQYSLNGGAYQTSTSFTGLAINTYTVTAEDANGCTVNSNSTIVTQPTALVAPVITGTNVLCNGGSTGAIAVSTIPTGGTSPYSYSLNGGAYQTSTGFTALPIGTYTVTAEDANSCTVTSNTVVVTQPTALTAPVITVTSEVTCNGASNGVVTVTTLPTGGTTPYQYSLSGSPYQTSTIFTGVAPGTTYKVTVQDANGCTKTSTGNKTVTQPTALTAPVITSTNVSCNGGSNGTVTVSTIPTGGTSPYTYSINGGAYQTSTSFTGLAANTYTVIAQDANSCTINSNSTIITQATALVAPVITGTNVLCNGGSTGTITVSALPTGGTSPYQYSLNGGAYQTSTSFTGLAINTYTVTAEDANSCTVISNSVVLTQPTALTTPVITVTSEVTCNGASNGVVTVTTLPTGGTTPYQYSLSGSPYQTSTIFTGVAPGTTYKVTVQDANGCTKTSTGNKTVTQPAALTAPVITSTNVSCNGGATGTVTVSTIPTGGTSPYTYSLNGGTYQTSTSFTGLTANTYTVTAQDANSCSISSNSTIITQPTALVAPVITGTNLNCSGANTGTITVSTIPTGGTSPYTYSLNGGTYQTSTSFTGLAANTYTVTAQDANSCTIASNSFTITQPAALTAPVITGTNLTCNANGSGVITVTTIPTGGTSPYQYSLNHGAYQTAVAFTGLSAGKDTVIAEDANGCSVSSNKVTLTQPAVLVAPVLTATNITCNGLSNGIINVTTIPTGGTSPYQYSINGGTYQTSTSFTGLAVNSYTVTAQDANGCTVNSAIDSITQPTAVATPTLTVTTEVLCNGASTGKLTGSLGSGGTTPYTYVLSNGTSQATRVFSNLPAGTYNMTVKDANGCTATSPNKTITQPAALVAPVITETNASCSGSANGTVSVSTLPTGGTSPYQYSLNGGAYQTSTSFTALAANTYTVTVEDANSCTITSNSVTVTQPTALVAPVITSTNVLCYGSANGTVTVSTLPTGGSSPYQYSLAGVTYQTGTVFTFLAPGYYTVTAKDANGCLIVSSNIDTITQPPSFTAPVISAPVITNTNVNCYGGSDGTINIITLPTGGTSPYEYSLNHGSFQTGTTFTGLSAGIDSVTAQDANGCIVNSNFDTLTQPNPLTAPVLTPTNVLCNGNSTGAITVSTLPTGGTPAYQYSLNGGTYQTSVSFTGLAANTYTVTVKDANGCTINSAASTVTQPASALATPTLTVSTEVLCNGAFTGKLTTSAASGGTSPYTYNLSNGTDQGTRIFSNLPAGTYTVTVKDTNGCTATTGSRTITQPTALVAPVITAGNVTCSGSGNGTVAVSTLPTGGTSPYTYSLNGGAYQTGTSFTALSPNTYTVTVEDANSCTILSNSVTLTQPTALVAPVISSTNVLCNGAANGTVSVSTIPTGGTSPYKYSLNGGAYQTSTSFSSLAPNTYTVTAEDANSCTIISNSVIITQPAAALSAPAITGTNLTCHANSSGIVTVTTLPTGGTSPYKYSLNGGAYQTSVAFTGLAIGTYTVTAQDANGCTKASTSVTLTQPAALTAPLLTVVNVSCNGLGNGTITVSTIPTGGTSPYQYSINGGAYQTSTSFTALTPNTYTVTAEDANSCSINSASKIITQPAVLTTPAVTGTNLACYQGADGAVNVTTLPTGGTTPYQYSLNGGAYQTSTGFTGLSIGTYSVNAEDANGCLTVASNSVTLTQPATALVAPTFTKTNITSCHGGTTGSVTINNPASGGVSPYQYSLNGGTYQTTLTWTGLPAGAYTITAKDAAGCTINSATKNITQPSAVTAPVITATNITCNGQANGTVNITTQSTGGTSPYQYSLNGGAYQTTLSFSNLGPNTYSVTAEDADNCTVSSNSVVLTQPGVLTAPVLTAINVTCNGAGNGTIAVSTLPTGGTTPYQYSLNGGAYQTGTGFSSLTPNTYTVTAKDANGCTANSTSSIITQPAVLTAPVITNTNVSCNGGATGTVSVSTIPTGGTTPYQYSLNGGTYQTSTAFNSLTANTYTVTAKDANGCVNTSNSVIVTQPTALTTPVITPTNITSCFGATTGVISVTTAPTGGASPYQYSLNGSAYQTSTAFNGLAANTYTVTAKDANGCTITSASATVTQPTALTAPVITASNIACNGTGTGAINVTTLPTGGTSPYQYSLNGGGYQTATAFSNLGPNTYTVTARDAGGCTINSASAIITQPSALTAPVITAADVNCNGASTGSISVSTLPTGGTSPYSYSLNGGAYQTSTAFTGLAANTYTVFAKDANGCIIASGSQIVTQPAALTAPVIINTNISCNGSNDGTVTVSTVPTGGVSPYSYSLNGGLYQTSTSFTGLSANTYAVNAKDANGCTIPSNSVIITEPAALGTPVITATNVTCNGDNNGVVQVTTAPTGGTNPYQYSLNGGAYQTGLSFTALPPATYDVTARDGDGCTVVSNTVTVSQNGAVSALASNTGPYAPTNTVALASSGSGGTGTYTFKWSGPLSYSSNSQNPSILDAAINMSGPYDVTVTDGNGCSATALTNVLVSSTIYTWTGNVDNNWGNVNNWSPPSPVGGPNSCGANVIIPLTTNQPIISSPVQEGNVVVDSSVQIELNSNLSVCQNWTGATTGNATTTGSGVVIFDGSVAQSISGNTTFGELRLNNTADASLLAGADINIETSLDLQAGNFDATNGSLTFLSTSVTQVAIIDNFSAGYQGTFSGPIHAERFYLASLTYNQHFMGSPVHAPLFSQFGAYGNTGYVTPKADCDESQMATGSPYGGVFSYNENKWLNAPHIANCGLSVWYVEPGNIASQDGRGYSILKPGGGVLTLNGTPNLNSTYTVPGLTNTNWSNLSLQNRDMESGWQLVSNPYLATLQVSTNPANASFDNQVQVWYCNGPMAGTYQAFMTGDDAVIPPFQAFQVHVSTASALPTPPTYSYTLSASDRVRTAVEFYAQNDNELNIVAQNITTGLLDQTMVAFNSHATDDFDPQYDANKFGGSLNRHTIYTLNHNKWMARNVLNSVSTTSTVPVGFEPGATGTYAFTFNKLSTFDPTTYIFLEDKQTGTMYNVRNGNYQFNADSADEWNRFVLHFTPPMQLATANSTCSTDGSINLVQPGNANWNYIITDANNATVASGILNQNSPVNVTVAAGNYTLKLVDNNNYTVVKSIVVGGAPVLAASFTAPAVIHDQSNVTFTANSPNATEFLWSFGDGSIVSGTSDPTYKYVQPGDYTVTLTVADAAGCSATYTQTVIVTSATGINNVGASGEINMWSYENRIYVDFTQLQHVDAVIKIYNILGQEIGSAEYTSNTVYQNVITNIDAAYVVVSVKNDDQITTRKLFIANTK